MHRSFFVQFANQLEDIAHPPTQVWCVTSPACCPTLKTAVGQEIDDTFRWNLRKPSRTQSRDFNQLNIVKPESSRAVEPNLQSAFLCQQVARCLEEKLIALPLTRRSEKVLQSNIAPNASVDESDANDPVRMPSAFAQKLSRYQRPRWTPIVPT